MKTKFSDKLTLNSYLLAWQLRNYLFAVLLIILLLAPLWVGLVCFVVMVLFDLVLRRLTCSHFSME